MTNNASLSTLQFTYDAPTNSYTVTTSGRSQSFGPSNKDALSNAQITVYKKTSAQTTDSLTLTNPGTSGILTYKYVGAGFWQRTTTTSSATGGTFDAFTYGVETPDSALRRTGAATYAVDLLGVKAYQDTIVSLSGAGTLDVDFVLSTVNASGTSIETNASGVSTPGSFWTGSATLSSTANSFSGNFALNPTETGSWSGRFYGPNTDEVGAAWYSKEGVNGVSSAGTLIGRYTKDIPTKDTNTDLYNLKYDTAFAIRLAGLEYIHDPTTTWINSSQRTSYRELANFLYAVGTKTYTFQYNIMAPSQYGPNEFSTALSTPKWNVYQNTNQNGTATLSLYNPSGWGSSLALSYMGFGSWTFGTKVSTTRDDNQELWFVYGLPANSGVPTTGSATYDGWIFGVGMKGSSLADITGTASLAINFAGQSFTGSMNPIATNRDTHVAETLPTYSIVNGSFFGGSNDMTGTINLGSASIGNLKGVLYGPQYQELGATFDIGHAGDASADYSMQGIIAAKSH